MNLNGFENDLDLKFRPLSKGTISHSFGRRQEIERANESMKIHENTRSCLMNYQVNDAGYII